jgi:hypothetical protein
MLNAMLSSFAEFGGFLSRRLHANVAMFTLSEKFCCSTTKPHSVAGRPSG